MLAFYIPQKYCYLINTALHDLKSKLCKAVEIVFKNPVLAYPKDPELSTNKDKN